MRTFISQFLTDHTFSHEKTWIKFHLYEPGPRVGITVTHSGVHDLLLPLYHILQILNGCHMAGTPDGKFRTEREQKNLETIYNLAQKMLNTYHLFTLTE
jgi:hypothetical protein